MARTEQRSPCPRGQGQWALGYHEPLDGAEQIRKEAEPLEVRERIERVFAPGGFRSIGKQDLRDRMRWWGLCTQRKQGVPGERTGSAEPGELEDEYFMLRTRIDGGRLTSAQLRAIAWVSETYGRDIADVTDRQNVQLHRIRIEDVPAIWGRLEATGLTTAEACGDTPRVILGPLAGIDADEILDASSAIAEIRDRFVGTTEFSNLPRKYKTSISGCAVRPAAAGIPVTHRGVARSFAVVTGSTAHDDEVDLSKIAGADTLVVLMAAGRLAQTCDDLVAAGRPAGEPAAIVQWAWTPDQRSVVGTLEDLPVLAEAANIGPPATLVVDAVAASDAPPGLERIPFAGPVSRGRLPATRRSRP